MRNPPTAGSRTGLADRHLSRRPRLGAALERRAHLSLVAIAVAFNCWVLRGELLAVQNFNDSSLHLAMVRWARKEIDQGRIPLDGWYPYLGMGLAQFHHYQSLPHILTAYLSLATGVEAAFYWILYLLLALWPVSVYVGTRLLGWDSWTAALAALPAPVVWSVTSYGFEHTSYMWWGLGMWSQLWGMWLLPLAWGLGWRAVSGRGSYALGSLAIAVTIACHFLTGYLALASVAVWVVVGLNQLLPRLLRAGVVTLGAFLIGSWVIVPLLSDSAWQPASVFTQGTFWDDSYGAPRVLRWLLSGELYDHGRLPILTVMVAAGLAVCLARFFRDERARAIVGVWCLSLALFCGRPTLGPLLKLLPGSDDLLLHRYLMGVHLAGLVLAGVGLAWLGRLAIRGAGRRLPRVRPQLLAAAAAAAAVVALGPAWTEVADYDQQGAALKQAQLRAEAVDGADVRMLVGIAKSFGDGRVFAGSAATWGQQYQVGYVPVYNELENYDADGVGFTLRVASLMTDTEVRFDELVPVQYDLFNVRYLILPRDRKPTIEARLLATQGRHNLWQVNTSGYLEVVDTVGPPIVAGRRNLGTRSDWFLWSGLLREHRFPTIAFNGEEAAQPTLPMGAQVSGPAGSFLTQSSAPDHGYFAGEFVADRLSVVLLKASYDPRWTVLLDGVEARPQMVAPAYVGVTVPPGRHTVAFTYASYPYYPILFGAGLLALACLALAPPLLRTARLWMRPGAASRRLPQLKVA